MIPPGEKIVEKKICRLSGQEFFITDKDLEFYDKVSPIFGGKKYSIPSPTLCPDERKRRRMCFRNDRHLSFSSVENKLSMYRKNYTSYEPKKFWGDDWNALDYGIKVDFGKSIFSQFAHMDVQVPKLARSIVREINCDYANQAGDLKDCYLTFAGNGGEKLLYGYRFLDSKDCIDFLKIQNCELCFEIVDCYDSYRLLYSQNCTNCRDSSFLYACSDCESCFGCTNLRSKKNYFFNEALSSDEYKKRMAELNLDAHKSVIIKKINILKSQGFFRENMNLKSENIIGDRNVNCKNVMASYFNILVEEAKFCDEVHNADHIYDIYSFGNKLEYCYEGAVVGNGASHCLFGVECWDSVSDIIYCMNCYKGTHQCFLSTGLKKHDHCILNIPYSVQEYETLCGKIIDHMISTGEWGEFFPHEISPFAYNETVAQEYFPMTESEVTVKGWNWYTEEDKKFEGSTYHPLPIAQYDERVVGFDVATKNINDCLAGMVQCEITKKPFKIIKQELVFYIENSIPIPTKHPDQRHKERMELRNPRTLYERACAECGREMITTYSPERPEKVVCEECYRGLVY